MIALVASSTNTAWWHGFSAPTPERFDLDAANAAVAAI
jgi:hypothetical protein